MHNHPLVTGGTLFALLFFAAPAGAQLRPLVAPPASAAAAQQGVEVFLINEGPVALPAEGPAEIETVAIDGARLRLIAAPDGPQIVQPGGFARMHYRLAASDGSKPVPVVTVAGTAPPTQVEAATRDSTGTASVIASLRPHEPTYGVYGTGDSGIKIQLSGAVRLLGDADGLSLNGAYTQTIFWQINRVSGPIRPNTYSPEVFVEAPLGKTTTAGFGYRHDSNGEDGRASIDVNRIFVRATKSIPIGGQWRFEVTPQAWVYFASAGRAADLDRYWGYTSLGLALVEEDGWKIATTLRGNPDSGRGAGELFVSHPLTRIGPAGLYLFGQGFTGFGEALSNYDRRDSHLRLGIAFTR